MSNVKATIEEVKKEIEDAFENVKYPGDEHLLHPQSYEESEVEDFQGKHWKSWKELPKETIDYNRSTLCFLSPEAYPFFLPAYMIHGLENPDSDMLTSTVYNLTVPDPSDPGQREYVLSQMSKFTSEQKKAITSFLECVKEQDDEYDEYDREDADKALQSYWKKMISEAMHNTERGSSCIDPRDRLIETLDETLDPGGGSTNFGYDLGNVKATFEDAKKEIEDVLQMEGWGFNPGMDKEIALVNAAFFEALAAVRDAINKKSFRGEDDGHREAADKARRAAENCRRRASQYSERRKVATLRTLREKSQ